MIDRSLLGPGQVRPLLRSEYDRLVDLGCFQDEKLELLDGTLVAMSPQGAAHAYAVRKLNMLITQAIGPRALVQLQSPLAVGDVSEPEPDLALVPNLDYSRAHPTRAFLVVEVAESSLSKDRLLKAAVYARAGIPEYWIVNLAERRIEVHRSPGSAGYAIVTTHGTTDILRPEAFADIEVAVASVLPTAGE